MADATALYAICALLALLASIILIHRRGSRAHQKQGRDRCATALPTPLVTPRDYPEITCGSEVAAPSPCSPFLCPSPAAFVQEPLHSGVVTVMVIDAKDLRPLRLFSKVSARVEIAIADTIHKTDIQYDSKNPVWNESFEFSADSEAALVVRCVNVTKNSKTDIIGTSVTVSPTQSNCFSSLPLYRESSKGFKVRAGTIQLRLSYAPAVSAQQRSRCFSKCHAAAAELGNLDEEDEDVTESQALLDEVNGPKHAIENSPLLSSPVNSTSAKTMKNAEESSNKSRYQSVCLLRTAFLFGLLLPVALALTAASIWGRIPSPTTTSLAVASKDVKGKPIPRMMSKTDTSDIGKRPSVLGATAIAWWAVQRAPSKEKVVHVKYPQERLLPLSEVVREVEARNVSAAAARSNGTAPVTDDFKFKMMWPGEMEDMGTYEWIIDVLAFGY